MKRSKYIEKFKFYSVGYSSDRAETEIKIQKTLTTGWKIKKMNKVDSNTLTVVYEKEIFI